MSSALMLLCASSGYLVRGSSVDAASAAGVNAREPLSHWTELTDASYDAEAAAL